ncbi:MAG: peptide chain release factor N(5)-glutamine methyltransferase [Candidatus Eremiobacteraeota bacterium]|nr:peptide chain release factor N(5)-glutamine methyltransferase [Candidatus Eremiobacteraeota bacterium]MBC5802166.1 peptide chain release factor N(5)-glutamine methyltransferase [Candidatus Eremiobacteraeota bacterium]MBC5821782.1 peptide chain release factor N(5)-glutamine methyltransferase [Candidatus Eremiobacteraeota bacterium]
MTVDEAIAEGSAALGNDAESARRDARLLVGNVLARTAAWMLANGDAVLADVDVARYRAAIRRRAGGEPIAYILGHVGFYGRTFAVTPDVLVPRPETEQLVARTLETFAGDRALRFCDVGTGSGAIALTLAAERPRASVVAIDVSAAALAVAARNAAALRVGERITFRLEDALENLERDMVFDAIVANLPYVRSSALASKPDPTSFEPRLALDGGRDGLGPYRKLLRRAPDHLARNGLLLMEAGPDKSEELAELALRALGGVGWVRILRDYAGLRRIVELRATPG